MLRRLQGSFKIYVWWNNQFPLMLFIIYLQLCMTKVPVSPIDTFFSIFLYLTASIGFASFGQLLIDLFDVTEDLSRSSKNLIVWQSTRKIIFKFVLMGSIATLPWLRLPMTPAILSLLCVELGLFIIYAMPPLRLKKRGILGPIVSALSLFVIPGIITLSVFGELCRQQLSSWITAMLTIWLLTVGLHTVMIKQLKDASQDMLARIQTFVNQYGWRSTLLLLERFIIPLEIISFLLLLILIGQYVPLVPIGFLGYLVWMIFRWKTYGIWQVANPLQLPRVERIFFCHFVLLLRYYTHWLPVLLLFVLVSHSPAFIILLMMHLYLFENGIVYLIRFELPEMFRIRRLL